jgi:mono/diheme cytochrome c family protein
LTPRNLTGVAAVGSIALALALGWRLSAQDGGRTVRDGVYSPVQAARGERLFGSICTNCHEIAEFTAAGAYLEDVEGQTLWQTFEYMSGEMPEDDPGSLRPEDYADVLGYLLSAYGLPSGATDLPAEQNALEEIRIVRPALSGQLTGRLASMPGS